LRPSLSLAVPAAGWVVQDHPEITPPSNFHQTPDTTRAEHRNYWALSGDAIARAQQSDLIMDRCFPTGMLDGDRLERGR